MLFYIFLAIQSDVIEVLKIDAYNISSINRLDVGKLSQDYFIAIPVPWSLFEMKI